MQTRRNFLGKLFGGLTLALIGLKSGLAWAKKMALKLDKVPKLKKVGGAMTIKLAGQEVILIRESDSTVRGLSPICSHQECRVAYNPKKRNIQCSCHGSAFDLKGNVLNGPATKPLKSYKTRLDGERIIISVD